MFRFESVLAASALLALCVCPSKGFAQANLPVAAAGDQIILKREPCRVLEVQKYRVPLSLEAGQTVTLVAPFDSTVKLVSVKPNAKVPVEGEVVKLDNTLQTLNQRRAAAVVKMATAELKEKEESGNKEIAQLKLEVAKIDLEIATAVLDQSSIRMPFGGEVQRILVTQNQFVRAGDPVAIVADQTHVKVEIPVDRASAENGKTVPFKIEQNDVEGKVTAVNPVPEKFEPLRELFDSLASVQLTVDNANGKFKPGQTVFAPMIPRQPVVEVSTSSIGNSPDGQRKVQVVRNLVVRDVPVKLLGQVGSTRIFVSGPFSDGDEVVYESSHQLGDGFQLKPSAVAATPTAPSTTGTSTPGTAPTKPGVGF